MELPKNPNKPTKVARKRRRDEQPNEHSRLVETEKSTLVAAAAIGAAQEEARTRGAKLKGLANGTEDMANASETFVELARKLKEEERKRAEEDTCCDCLIVGFLNCCPWINSLCDKCTDCLDC